jgi:hypothetical protein
MEADVGLIDRTEARRLQGAGSSAQVALGAVRTYAGDTVADIAGDVVGAASEAAIGGVNGRPGQAALITARDWDVTNLEILKSRKSHENYVMQLRYDLSAAVAGRRQAIATDLMQTTRLEYRDGRWVVAAEAE